MPTETLMMKDSGIDCIAEIPENWEVKRLKFILNDNTNNMRVGPFGTALTDSDFKESGYWVYNQRCVLDNNFDTNDAFINEQKYRELKSFKVFPNDILITTRGTIGKVAIIPQNIHEGVLHPCLIRFVVNRNYIDNNFIKYIFNDTNIAMQQIMNKSNSTTIEVIYSYNLKDIYLVIPSITEQQAIADFLDEKCEKIDKVIGEIEEQIQVLENYKKSLITETVIEGLDKNVPMKDSGIDWIGKIPGNWQIKKIKYLFKVINGSTPDSDYLDYWDGDITWITPADMPDFGYISKGERSITLKGYKSCGTTLVPYNSIVVSSRAPIGKINITEDTLCTNQGCKCLVSNNLCNKYYYYFLYSQKEQLIDAGRGTTFIELSTYSLSNFYALLPPIKIQEQIAGYLDKECTKIDKTISDKKEQLETIKEYKKSLIYEYVTGKKRVAC